MQNKGDLLQIQKFSNIEFSLNLISGHKALA